MPVREKQAQRPISKLGPAHARADFHNFSRTIRDRNTPFAGRHHADSNSVIMEIERQRMPLHLDLAGFNLRLGNLLDLQRFEACGQINSGGFQDSP